MHNGGAYGDGTAQSSVGLEPGAAGTTGKHGQFALASRGTGEPGADHSDECLGKNEPRNCRAVGTGESHGRQVAAPISGAGCGRAARRVASGPPSSDQRRTRGPVDSQNARDETAKRHALEHPADRTPDATVEVHRAPHLAGIRVAAAPPAAFQAFQRSVLRREGARHRGVVSASPRKCSSFVCR